jgi:hypothetical protein
MELIRGTGGTAVLTLAAAPDWMKGGAENAFDPATIEVAPLPEHYQDFADLAVAALKRYPFVRYVQVWNELKGFYDASTNDWDIAAYTAMYNKVYSSIRAYDPQIRIGGPYVPMDSWSSADIASHPSSLQGDWGVVDGRALDAITYWLKHKAGADFVTVDGSTATKDHGLVTDPVRAAEKFSAITRWIGDRTSLPIWWAELYVPGADDIATPATLEAAFDELRGAGARVALLWDPQHEDGEKWAWLWTDTSKPDGGMPGPFQELWQEWSKATSTAPALD